MTEKDRLFKYLERDTLMDYFITKNITILIGTEEDKKIIMDNTWLLGFNNFTGKTSMNILIENNMVKNVIELIKHDYKILNFSTKSEKNIFQTIILYEEYHQIIIDILKFKIFERNEENIKFMINLIDKYDKNGTNFIDITIRIIEINGDNNITNLVYILKLIYNLNPEDKIFRIVETLCKTFNSEKKLTSLIKYINPNELKIYPNSFKLTCIDYLILNDMFYLLKYLIPRIHKIHFVNTETNTLFELINKIDNKEHTTIFNIIEIIDEIQKKSNIKNIRNPQNDNIIIMVLNMLNKNKYIFTSNNKKLLSIIKSIVNDWNIFEQNTYGDNIYNILMKEYPKDINYILDKSYTMDTQIKIKIKSKNKNIDITKINYNFNIKKFLKFTVHGIFISDILHNMIYTTIVLKSNDNLEIPYIKQTHTQYLNTCNQLLMSTLDKDVLTVLKQYYYSFSNMWCHCIVWKSKYDYWINPDLIKWIIEYIETPTKKRFIYIKLSIIANNQISGTMRHANLILIDTVNKVVERFEPYGDIHFLTGNDLNKMIKENIVEIIKYKYVIVQSYPGFQIRSGENENKSHGDPFGFCLAWCFMYLELKLFMDKNMKRLKMNDDKSDLVISLINNYVINVFSKDFKNIDTNNNLYMCFIRFYAKQLDHRKNLYINSYGISVQSLYKQHIDEHVYKNVAEKINTDFHRFSGST